MMISFVDAGCSGASPRPDGVFELKDALELHAVEACPPHGSMPVRVITYVVIIEDVYLRIRLFVFLRVEYNLK
jgi:hypothetical protein